MTVRKFKKSDIIAFEFPNSCLRVTCNVMGVITSGKTPDITHLQVVEHSGNCQWVIPVEWVVGHIVRELDYEI
jgi:hypothetical protein